MTNTEAIGAIQVTANERISATLEARDRAAGKLDPVLALEQDRLERSLTRDEFARYAELVRS